MLQTHHFDHLEVHLRLGVVLLGDIAGEDQILGVFHDHVMVVVLIGDVDDQLVGRV